MTMSLASVITTPGLSSLEKKVPEPATVLPLLLLYAIVPDRVVDHVESALQLPACRLVAVKRSSRACCAVAFPRDPGAATRAIRSAAQRSLKAGRFKSREERPVTDVPAER
jgi:hypothetical protein